MNAAPRGLRRTLWLGLGWLSLGLALIGALLPIMPSTCFVLLAAWAFGRSSPRLAAWLRGLPLFGRVILDWERDRAMPPLAKAWAIVLITLSFGATITLAVDPLWLRVALGLTAAALIGWIASLPRPLRPPGAEADRP